MSANAQSASFNNRAIRWLINSFINDIDINKSNYNGVVSQLKYKHIFSTEVVPLLVVGTRLVAFDNCGLCNNCYHYGQWSSTGSEHGFCMNHIGWYRDYEDKGWMTFKQYTQTSGFSYHYEEFESYRLDCEVKFRKKKERFKREGYW